MEKVTNSAGNVIIHISNPLGQKCVSLCGCDLVGDSIPGEHEFGPAKFTKEKATCKHCYDIVQGLKGVSLARDFDKDKLITPYEWGNKLGYE